MNRQLVVYYSYSKLTLLMMVLLFRATTTDGFLLHPRRHTSQRTAEPLAHAESRTPTTPLFLYLDHHDSKGTALPYNDDPCRRTIVLNALASLVVWTTITAVATFPTRADAANNTNGKNNNKNIKDISGLDFSGQDLSNKDFTKVMARMTKFNNCNLQGSSFVQADLTGADFSGANLQEVSFVDAILDGTTFNNAQAQRTWFSKTILDIADAENVDLTDSMWPSALRIMICDMDEIRGKNPVTNVDSKESLLCTDINYKS